jgi:biopolymer transport protein ExbD
MGIDIDSGGGKSKVRPTMNITPLVDVVLVLLIIFMVITPLLTKQFWVHVPKKPENQAESKPDPNNPPVVLSVDEKGVIRVGPEVVPAAQLAHKLKRVFAARSDHNLFFKASDDAPYGNAVEALDLARAGGAVTIAVLTEKLFQQSSSLISTPP